MVCCESTKTHIGCPVKHPVIIWVSHPTWPILLWVNVFFDVFASHIIPLDSIHLRIVLRLQTLWKLCCITQQLKRVSSSTFKWIFSIMFGRTLTFSNARIAIWSILLSCFEFPRLWRAILLHTKSSIAGQSSRISSIVLDIVVYSINLSCFRVLLQRLLVLLDWMLELVDCILSICILCFYNRVLNGRLLHLECLVSWAFSRIGLRLENLWWKVFVWPNLLITYRWVKWFLWFAHAEIFLIFAWTLTLKRLILSDLYVSSSRFGIQVVSSCHWLLNLWRTVGVKLFTVVLLA